MFRRKHKFIWEYSDGSGAYVDTPGVRYHCSCGWSQGWIASVDVRKARRINRIAHKVMKLRERAGRIRGE